MLRGYSVECDNCGQTFVCGTLFGDALYDAASDLGWREVREKETTIGEFCPSCHDQLFGASALADALGIA